MFKCLWCKIISFWSISSNLLYHFHKKKLFEVGCILIEQRCVCLAPYFVKSGWISLFSSAGIQQRMFLVYPEVLVRAIGEERFEQLHVASVINFRVFGISIEKYRIFVTRGCFIKDYMYVLRKIEVGRLYFSANSRLTNLRNDVCKNQNIVNLPEFILARDVLRCFQSSL